MCALLVPELLDRFFHVWYLKSLSIIGECPLNVNILAPKVGAPQMSPANKIATFLKMTDEFDYFLLLYGDHFTT
jgi:hypothetical protein